MLLRLLVTVGGFEGIEEDSSCKCNRKQIDNENSQGRDCEDRSKDLAGVNKMQKPALLLKNRYQKLMK